MNEDDTKPAGGLRAPDQEERYDATASALKDNETVDKDGKRFSSPTLRSQMKHMQSELSSGRSIVGPRGERIQITEKRFTGLADAASRRRRERMGNSRFTPKQ